ncbi:MAG TPA: S8 family peptidase, partial [Burkholderiaceae bacterium]|nr:S8 family peptidase [Burkholderiaceae bacterium]
MTLLPRRRFARSACLLALLGAGAFTAWPAGAPERMPARRGSASAPAETEARVIVKYKADAALLRASAPNAATPRAQHAQALGGRLGLALTDGRTIGDRAQVLKARGLSSRALAERLGAQADVEYAVVDGRVHALAAPNDPLYPNGQTAPTPLIGQWYLRAPTSATIVDATSIVSAINAQAAWDVTTGSAGVVVGVLDTGVRLDHPDLAGKLRTGYDFVGGNGTATAIAVANDGGGRDADPSDPGDWITATEANTSGGPFYQCGDKNSGGAYIGSNSSWHGTQTAGLIGAATNNGTGMAGTGYNVTVLPVRVLGKCGGYDSDIQAAMLWAAGLSSTPTAPSPAAKVLNMSLGGSGACSAAYIDVFNQLFNAGVSVVVAAGNEGLAVATPANCPHAIGVAGVRHAGTKVGYSDLGPEVSIAAPAGNCVNSTGACLFPILTTSNKGTTTPVADSAGGSIYTDDGANPTLGTSFSAPMVAGTVALMLSANPALTPTQVLTALKATARPFPSTGAAAGTPACTAPSATAQSNECYCTTSTCGAGLLDA